MALYVNTNVASIWGQGRLASATRNLDGAYQKLSSGLRINSAKDDAAGLQISDRMMAQINGLTQGNRNCLDGISLLQVAEGALDEVTNMIQRMRTLAVQSANGANSQDERLALQQEVQQLSQEVNRIAKQTTWGGEPILDGEQEYKYFPATRKIMPMSNSHPSDPNVSCRDPSHTEKRKTIQAGAYAGHTIDFTLGIHYDKVYCNAGCGNTFPTKALLGFDMNGLYCSAVDIDNPAFLVEPAIDANTDFSTSHQTGMCIGNDGLLTLDVSTAAASQKAIEICDSFVRTIDSHRAEMGSVENRLESAISNQENVIENVSDARSRIRDCDFACETAKQTMYNILQQGATTVLSQANQQPQIALSLLNS
ncbi:MAG: flagellin [Succinivibrionaceae bacterium]|nr:flagellin [Succinivibrionaceae bacterium]